MRKVLKKGKRGNKKDRLATYEEIFNQGNTPKSYRVGPDVDSLRSSSH
jgi:hypothetical protein